jgi:amino acid transporter
MDGMISFDGVIGVLILLATMVFMALSLLVCAIVVLVRRHSDRKTSTWPKSFLLSSAIILVLDGLFLMSLWSQPLVLSKDQAEAFDERMILFWLPCHIIGYFGIAYFIHRTQFSK